MSVEYDNRLKKIHDDAFPLNYILPAMALVALIFLGVTFIFNKDKEHKTETFEILPQLKEHRVRLVRPDGAVDKIVTIKNYDNTSKVFSGKAGNLYVLDFTGNNYEYVAPIGWNLEPVNENEE
jgi:hypothetical protein